MAEINGIIYIVIGAFIAIASLFLGARRFMLFIIAGIVMVIIGIIKILSQKKAIQKSHTPITHHPSPPPTTHHHPRIYKYCPKCGTVGHVNDYYCSRCGTNLIMHKR